MGVNRTLSTKGLLVGVAVSVGLLLRMPLTTKDPRDNSWCQGLVKRDELVVCRYFCLEVWLLAGAAEELRTVFAEFCGWVFLADLADHIVRIFMALTRKKRSSSSQHGGGKAIHRQRRRGISSGGGCCFQFKARSTHRTSQLSLNY